MFFLQIWVPRHGRSFNAAVLIPGESDDVLTFLTCHEFLLFHTFPSTRSICLWSVGLWHSPSHAPGRRSFCRNSPSCRVHTIHITCRIDPSRQKYNPRGHCRSFRTCNRKTLQHDVNTVIWPCRLQWRFNYINHSDEKTTDKRNNMTDMTTTWNTLSLCQKPVQTPLRLHEGATAKLSTASAFLPDSHIIKMLESDSQELSFQARSYWQRQFVLIAKRCRFLVLT